VQTVEARRFSEPEVAMLVEAAAEVAPVVSIARTLDRFIAPLQERLWALARNLWWSWDQDSTSLFRELDPVRWRILNHNPISLLGEIPLAAIERRARELVLHGRINYAYRRQREYLAADRTWGATHAGVLRPHPVAYFSAEFGLHESFPIYSGGLGVLAVDPVNQSIARLVFLLFVLGCGVGPMYPMSTIVMQNAVKPHQLGTATGTLNFFRTLGGAIIVAVFGAIVLSSGVDGAGVITLERLAAAHGDLAPAFRSVFIAAVICLAIAFCSLLAVEERPLHGPLRRSE